jgi:ribonucleotide monophosphatase NagD (HAD superfamily)
MCEQAPECLSEQIANKLIDNVDNFLFDCDGVIWHDYTAIPGSVECINSLKTKHNKRCFFITNNSTKTRQAFADVLTRLGIKNVNENDVVSTGINWLF